MNKLQQIVDFLYEALHLKRTQRTGYWFLGKGSESVAEHSHGATVIAFVLSKRVKNDLDVEKLLKMILFHDLPESRTGDLNYVNKIYNQSDEKKALETAVQDLSFAEELIALQAEWQEGTTLEAKLAKDADQLDFIMELQRMHELGSKQAEKWLKTAIKRLKTYEAMELAKEIMKTDINHWWEK